MAVHSLSYPSPTDGASTSSRDVLIYFISGNPGLIDYYESFLSTLRHLLDSSPSSRDTRFHIYGQDLAGFDDNDHKPFTSANPPHDVAYQIQDCFDTLSGLRVEDGPRKGKPYDDVLLMGHSVGTYIILQIFHRLLRDPASAPQLHLRAGILLFPTIEHINRSPQGLRLDLLRRTPVLGAHAHLVARGFLRLWPRAALSWFVRTVLGFPPHAADVTVRFLQSRDGVWQALHMGMDEMQAIGEGQWDDKLWEIEAEAEAAATGNSQQQQQQVVPKFFFFFGKDDHWVASHLRDEFIERMSQKAERTRCVVDEGNLPHAFCIRNSETVAEKALHWINEIYDA
ncbi:uncharacterized protein JN550_005151 [Neoarthrinium moseri]|uniref:uncharacterized protein n=1 Tax=Neoarthrinium moseri TaxID=1658444 RepID=UPI001FDD54C9|nr:uncharacterized protein JN550_005151 [Neoarthrinium moseri]KAI1870608.1 hypothetical protein JN550_005151 [Neoarthrinium moseri]